MDKPLWHKQDSDGPRLVVFSWLRGIGSSGVLEWSPPSPPNRESFFFFFSSQGLLHRDAFKRGEVPLFSAMNESVNVAFPLLAREPCDGLPFFSSVR